MNLLNVAGLALWIVALSIMASASRAAWNRIEPGVKVPLTFARDGRPALLARRAVALCLLPGAAFVTGLLLMVLNRDLSAGGEAGLILFGLRATGAALFALTHLRWLAAAMAALDKEGALKP